MSERRDGPLCADCDWHGEEPQTPRPAVTAASQENVAPPQTAVAGPQETLAGSVPEDMPAGLTPDERPDEDPAVFVPARVGCRTELRGWAGAHLHGAVRPRRRSMGHGRPPGRWC